MKTIVIAFFIACLVGSSLAQDCSAKFKDFHKCMDDSHKQAKEGGKAKFAALKTKIDACYTDNGCTPPAKPEGKGASSGGSSGGSSASSSGERRGNNTEGRECRKALRQAAKEQFEACIKKSIPGFTMPQKDGQHDKAHWGGHHKGMNHKDENKNLDSCAKKQQVRDCKRALFESNKPTEDEKKAHFKANCDAKDKCLAALGAQCQDQMKAFKKAACQCGQQMHQEKDKLRSSVKACEGVQDKQGQNHQGKDRKERSCDDSGKDYCKLGYDAFAQDHQKDHQGKGGHH